MTPMPEPRTSRMARVDALSEGDVIEREAYGLCGEITTVVRHGRSVGDGTVDWFTLRVRPDNLVLDHGPSITVGPMRADRLLKCWS